MSSWGLVSVSLSPTCAWLPLCVLSHFSCFWLFVTLWTVACQAPLSMIFSRQEYWSGLPLPPPGIFPTQELNPYLLCPLYCRWTLYCWATREAHYGTYHIAIFLKKTIFFQLYLYPHHENIFVICLRAPSSQPVSMHPPCFYVIHFLNQSNGYPKNQ